MKNLAPRGIKIDESGPYNFIRDSPKAWLYRKKKYIDVHLQINCVDGMKHLSFTLKR